jgi:hypothetical protein
MGNNQSYTIDWDTINEFKNRINQNTFDPFMVGRMQKLLIELCNRVDCVEILTNNIHKNGKFNFYSSKFNRIELTSNKSYENLDVIDIIFNFIKDILFSNARYPGLSQDSIATLSQIAYMTDEILYEYIRRSITVFRYNTTELSDYVFIYHVLFTYSYY